MLKTLVLFGSRRYCHNETLASLTCVSKDFNLLIAPVLYDIISTFNSPLLQTLLLGTRNKHINTIKNIKSIGDISILLQLAPNLQKISIENHILSLNLLLILISDYCSNTIRTVSITRCPLSDNAIHYILGYKKLLQLDLSYTYLSTQALFTLLGHSSLKELTLRGLDTTNITPAMLPDFHTLLVLDISYSKVSDNDIQGLLPHLPNLQTLSLVSCKSLTDDSVLTLSKTLSRIQNLYLGDLDRISDVSVYALGTFGSRLRVLDLTRCIQISEECLIWFVRKVGGLRGLVLDGLPFLPESLFSSYSLSKSISDCVLTSKDLASFRKNFTLPNFPNTKITAATTPPLDYLTIDPLLQFANSIASSSLLLDEIPPSSLYTPPPSPPPKTYQTDLPTSKPSKRTSILPMSTSSGESGYKPREGKRFNDDFGFGKKNVGTVYQSSSLPVVKKITSSSMLPRVLTKKTSRLSLPTSTTTRSSTISDATKVRESSLSTTLTGGVLYNNNGKSFLKKGFSSPRLSLPSTNLLPSIKGSPPPPVGRVCDNNVEEEEKKADPGRLSSRKSFLPMSSSRLPTPSGSRLPRPMSFVKK